MKKAAVISLSLAMTLSVSAKDYTVTSPDGKLTATISAGKDLSWSVSADGQQVLAPSAIAMTLADGTTVGTNPKVKKTSTKSVKRTIKPDFYKKAEVSDNYNQLTLNLKDGFSLQVRAYDDAVAYRLVSDRKGKMTVKDELAEFNFPTDGNALIPYINDNRGGEKYTFSFESYYDKQKLSEMFADSLAITPLLVDQGKYRVVVSDFGIDDYPGMFLKSNGNHSLVAEFAPVPLEGDLGGYNHLNFIPSKRADYIAADVDGKRAFPWRAVIVTDDDRALANSDMAVRLSPESRVKDTSWIKPGKVAWDWWNALHVTGVDFKAGVNNDTYNYYIDFAHDNGLEYIIVDEGWSDENSILKVRDKIDVQKLVDYGKSKGVGVILWASWKNVHRELEEAMKKYADMGVAGFKIDFFDADDQNMVRDMARFARVAADNHLLLDYHGMKANGMQVTYPNILNFEGVKGLENYKWSSVENNPPEYAVTAPYLRTIVGPMDYTPGAMTNATTKQHRADNDNPMSEGTRCNQLAMYVVYDAPLQMLADTPVRYRANRDCTDAIAQVPTVFDETVVLDGKIGEYIVTAKRNGDKWYIGAMTNRTPRDLNLDLSFLGKGDFMMQSVSDGVNVDIDASDHKHSRRVVDADTQLKVNLAPAGGFFAIISPVK